MKRTKKEWEEINRANKEQMKQQRLFEQKREALSTLEYIAHDLGEWEKLRETQNNDSNASNEQLVNSALVVLFGIKRRAEFAIANIRPSIFRGSGFIFVLWLSLVIYLGVIGYRDSGNNWFDLARAVNRLSLIFFLCFVIGLMIIIQHLVNKSGRWKPRTWRGLLILWSVVFIVGCMLQGFNSVLSLIVTMCAAIVLMLFINLEV